MPRLERRHNIGLANHVISRTVGNLQAFRDFEDHAYFYDLIEEFIPLMSLSLFNISLIPNHFHLVTSEPVWQEDFSSGMKQILMSYSVYHKKKYARTGVLWNPRFKTFPVNNDGYLLTVSAYVDLNPFRAGLTGDSYEHAWSSASHYLSGQKNRILCDNPAILAISEDEKERRRIYREILDMWANNSPSRADVANFFRRQPIELHPDYEVAKKVSDTLGVRHLRSLTP